jgi:hypothetical protein
VHVFECFPVVAGAVEVGGEVVVCPMVEYVEGNGLLKQFFDPLVTLLTVLPVKETASEVDEALREHLAVLFFLMRVVRSRPESLHFVDEVAHEFLRLLMLFGCDEHGHLGVPLLQEAQLAAS